MQKLDDCDKKLWRILHICIVLKLTFTDDITRLMFIHSSHQAAWRTKAAHHVDRWCHDEMFFLKSGTGLTQQKVFDAIICYCKIWTEYQNRHHDPRHR